MNDKNEQITTQTVANEKTSPQDKKADRVESQLDEKLRKGRRESNIDKFFSGLTSKMPLPELLKKQLQGVIFCKIDGHDSDYVIDLRTDKLIVLKRSEVKEELKYDCTIRIKRYDIEELIVGELNPQIAMLSHKIQITGSMNMAMYFFNLFD